MNTELQSSAHNPLKTLLAFGLEERTARIYLALLELGQASVVELSKKSGVERVAIYYLLKDLHRLQLVKEIYDDKNRLRLQPASPQHLIKVLDEKRRAVAANLPELEAIFQETPDQPRFRLFKGVAGIEELYDDLIETMRRLPMDKREIITYTPIDLLEALPIHDQKAFRTKRQKYQIPIRVISNDTPAAHAFMKYDVEELRQTRLFPVGTPVFTATQVIYANKVAQYNVRGEIHVPVIENIDLATTQRTIFEVTWNSLKPQRRFH